MAQISGKEAARSVGDPGLIPGPLEKGMATHCNVLSCLESQKSEQWITGQTESPETDPQKESPDLRQRSKGDSGEKRVSSLMGLHGGLCTFW